MRVQRLTGRELLRDRAESYADAASSWGGSALASVEAGDAVGAREAARCAAYFGRRANALGAASDRPASRWVVRLTYSALPEWVEVGGIEADTHAEAVELARVVVDMRNGGRVSVPQYGYAVEVP